jgi:hypothetical protein
MFLAAERGIPYDPSSHAAYVGSWIKALRDDKHEIFRAAQDASRAADFVLKLERDQSLAEAVEVAAPERIELDDATFSPDEKAARSTEMLVAAEPPIRREIVDLEADRDSALNGRTKEVTPIHTAQPDRERLSASFDDARKMVAEIFGDTGRTLAALTSSGTYRGKIIGETDNHLLQQISGRTVVAHMKHTLSSMPQLGENVVIAYSNSKATVSECQQRTHSHQLAR